MPDYLSKALFVVIGLLLQRQLIVLLPHAAHPAARFLVNAVLGLCALLTANTVGSLFGAGIGLNAVTIPLSAGLGIPGVALLWIIRYLL